MDFCDLIELRLLVVYACQSIGKSKIKHIGFAAIEVFVSLNEMEKKQTRHKHLIVPKRSIEGYKKIIFLKSCDMWISSPFYFMNHIKPILFMTNDMPKFNFIFNQNPCSMKFQLISHGNQVLLPNSFDVNKILFTV